MHKIAIADDVNSLAFTFSFKDIGHIPLSLRNRPLKTFEADEEGQESKKTPGVLLFNSQERTEVDSDLLNKLFQQGWFLVKGGYVLRIKYSMNIAGFEFNKRRHLVRFVFARTGVSINSKQMFALFEYYSKDNFWTASAHLNTWEGGRGVSIDLDSRLPRIGGDGKVVTEYPPGTTYLQRKEKSVSPVPVWAELMLVAEGTELVLKAA